ncbi:hypothetical protein [Candidatus Clavichlamydia salmonicola]|uniref:hypothetical protein n=1 Tax=Candidatus Clavichlamydia salmonicola TaxID=469812 RepID=UPI0018917316|nr:hypothetical protein [Candidatus Clavichlamydia salmonicola]
MSSCVAFLCRECPADISTELRNIKHNMCNGWKITRLVTSTIMSAAAATLVFTCSTCTNKVDESHS